MGENQENKIGQFLDPGPGAGTWLNRLQNKVAGRNWGWGGGGCSSGALCETWRIPWNVWRLKQLNDTELPIILNEYCTHKHSRKTQILYHLRPALQLSIAGWGWGGGQDSFSQQIPATMDLIVS
jgi:hypothetical protein